MNGIRPHQKKFIEKFKKGFKIGDTMVIERKPPSGDSGLKR
jgi:hypothetical protein